MCLNVFLSLVIIHSKYLLVLCEDVAALVAAGDGG